MSNKRKNPKEDGPMQISIVVLKDGTPCIVFNKEVPDLTHVAFSYKNYLLTLFFDREKNPFAPQSKTVDFPLEHDFVELLEERENVAAAIIERGAFVGIQMIPVVFSKT